MKQVGSKEKEDVRRSLTDSTAAMAFKDLIRPALGKIASLRVPYKTIIEEPCEPLPGKAIIFAVNHSCFSDTPIMARVTPKRSYILLGKQNLGFSDWLFFMLNGVIFVDRKNKADMAASKRAMVSYLQKGRSIIMFPEGTWNLTENLLMMPMKWGIIDVAINACAQIVPTDLEYDRENKKCFVRFGSPMVFTEEDDKTQAIKTLRDTMATMRWEQINKHQLYHADIREEWNSLTQAIISEYLPLDWEYEKSCIFTPSQSPQDAFNHLESIRTCKENAFLLNRNNHN